MSGSPFCICRGFDLRRWTDRHYAATITKYNLQDLESAKHLCPKLYFEPRGSSEEEVRSCGAGELMRRREARGLSCVLDTCLCLLAHLPPAPAVASQVHGPSCPSVLLSSQPLCPCPRLAASPPLARLLSCPFLLLFLVCSGAACSIGGASCYATAYPSSILPAKLMVRLCVGEQDFAEMLLERGENGSKVPTIEEPFCMHCQSLLGAPIPAQGEARRERCAMGEAGCLHAIRQDHAWAWRMLDGGRRRREEAGCRTRMLMWSAWSVEGDGWRLLV